MYNRLKKEGRIHEHPEEGYQLSDATIRHIHSMLHGAMKDAVQAHIIPRNPTEGPTAPRLNYKPKCILNEQELGTFMDTIREDEVWYEFFYTELMTGLRRGEICGLMWKDFDEKKGTLNVCRTLHSKEMGVFALGATKTSKGTRTIILPQSIVKLLRQRKKWAVSQWIFPNPTSPELPASPDSAYRRLKVLLKRTGLPDIRFHDLRHPNVKPKTKTFLSF